jgi:hypothetical protein
MAESVWGSTPADFHILTGSTARTAFHHANFRRHLWSLQQPDGPIAKLNKWVMGLSLNKWVMGLGAELEHVGVALRCCHTDDGVAVDVDIASGKDVGTALLYEEADVV